MPEGLSRLRQVLKLIAINCLVLATGILILELVFGGWLNSKQLNRLNLFKDTVFEFDISDLYADANPLIHYSRDTYGLRGAYGDPGDIDILTVGGSTTDQRYIRDGETWQDQLQTLLRQSGLSVDIANAGVDGQSSYGHIKNFQWWFPYIPGLAPDYIIFYIGLNDFHKEAGDTYDRLLNADEAFSLEEAIKDNSAVRHLIRTLRGAYEAIVEKEIGHEAVDFSTVEWTYDARQADYAFMQIRLDEYAERLRILADLSRDFGAEPVFVSQPAWHYRFSADVLLGNSRVRLYDDYEYNGVDFYYMMRRLDRVTAAVAEEKKMLYLDLASISGWVESDYYDFVHMTPQGVEKIARFLHGPIQELLKSGRNSAAAL